MGSVVCYQLAISRSDEGDDGLRLRTVTLERINRPTGMIYCRIFLEGVDQSGWSGVQLEDPTNHST